MTHSKYHVNRDKRHFLQFAGFTLGSLALSHNQRCFAKPKGEVTSDIHLSIADKAKAIAKPGSTLELLLPNGSQANMTPVANLFKALTNIDVRFKIVAVDEINTHMLVGKVKNQLDFDIALPASFGIPDLAAADAIADLSAYQQLHEPKSLADGALYTHADSFQNKFYGYQTDGDCYLMFYNKQFITNTDNQSRYEDKFGTPLRAPTTWQELDRQMHFFHSPHKLEFGGALFRTPEYALWEWWLRSHAKNNLPLDQQGKPKIDSDAAVAALEEMVAANEALYPKANFNGLFDNWKAYRQGNIYANIGWGGSQKYFNQADSKIKDQLIFSLPPGDEHSGRKEVAYFNWGWNFTVSSHSKHPELAYLFCLFSVCPETSTLSVAQSDGFFDPFRPEHYADTDIQDVYSEEFLAVHQKAMQNCIPDFYISGRNGYLNALQKYIALALQKELTPKRALSLARKSWAKLHIRHGIDKQRRQWQALRKKYQSVNFI